VIGETNPAKDHIAFASAATTGFRRDHGEVTPASLAIDACIAAIRDAEIPAEEINGLVGANPEYIQASLGIPHLTYWNGPGVPFVSAVANAMNAIATGAADVVLAYHSLYRNPMFSRSAASDPFRAGTSFGSTGGGMVGDGFGPDSISGAVGYTAWASRYLAEYQASRETFGYVAINNRSNAADNPAAALRNPITMDDYFAARMITTPFCLYDCDVPVDGSTAVVVSAVEHAGAVDHPVARVEAVGTALRGRPSWDQFDDMTSMPARDAAAHMWSRTDLRPADVDVAELYDGFSWLAMAWLEALGFCGPGESGPFIEGGGRIALDGELPLNTHGGQLSAGRLHGFGFLHEAVVQLRGEGGDRQAPGSPEVAVVANGGGPVAGSMLLTRLA
jgi:acetyl-CoA acetyltransferase